MPCNAARETRTRLSPSGNRRVEISFTPTPSRSARRAAGTMLSAKAKTAESITESYSLYLLQPNRLQKRDPRGNEREFDTGRRRRGPRRQPCARGLSRHPCPSELRPDARYARFDDNRLR